MCSLQPVYLNTGRATEHVPLLMLLLLLIVLIISLLQLLRRQMFQGLQLISLPILRHT